MRDLTEASPDEVVAERAKVATEGWGAQLRRGHGARQDASSLLVDQRRSDSLHTYWYSVSRLIQNSRATFASPAKRSML
jgi:hypothetical protein